MVSLKSVYLDDVFQGPGRLSVQEKGQIEVEMENSQSLGKRAVEAVGWDALARGREICDVLGQSARIHTRQSWRAIRL